MLGVIGQLTWPVKVQANDLMNTKVTVSLPASKTVDVISLPPGGFLRPAVLFHGSGGTGYLVILTTKI